MQSKNILNAARTKCADGKMQLCCDIQPRCTSTSSPAQNSNQDFQVFSALDVLDYILQLLFGIHVEGLPGLYCCQLQRRQSKRVYMKPQDLNSGSPIKNLKLLWYFFKMTVKIKLLMWFALDICTSVFYTIHFPVQIQLSSSTLY